MSAVKTPTQESATDLLAANADEAIAVGKLADQTADALAAIGQRGEPGAPGRGIPAVPASGRIGNALRSIIAAHAENATSGGTPAADVAALEQVVVDLEAERAQLELVLVGCRQRQRSVISARSVILASRQSELEALARVAVEDAEPAWLDLQTAARTVEAHRQRVAAAVDLALAGHPGRTPGATAGAAQAARKLRESFAPWVGAAPESNALWAAVSRVGSPPVQALAQPDASGEEVAAVSEDTYTTNPDADAIIAAARRGDPPVKPSASESLPPRRRVQLEEPPAFGGAHS